MNYVSTRQAAQLAAEAGHSISHPTWCRWLVKHEGLGVRIGARWRIPARHVEEILAGRPVSDVAKVRADGLAKA